MDKYSWQVLGNLAHIINYLFLVIMHKIKII